MDKSLKQTVFVNAIIHNAQQQVLLVRRPESDHFLPGYLELPGGRVEPGEPLEHALQRKLKKELDLKAAAPMYFCSLADTNKTGPYVRAVFELAYSQDEPIALSGAHQEFVWIERSELTNEQVASDTERILQQYLGMHTEVASDEKNTSFTVYTDGGSRGNPGPSASAYVIYNKYSEIIESGGSYIGITSNNQAEYTAVLLALQALTKIASSNDTIVFNADSLLVVNQMNGLYKIKNRELWPLNQQIRELMQGFKEVRFNHIPRENNVAADKRVNEILDAHSGSDNL